MKLTYPRFTIDRALMEAACYPEKAKAKAIDSAAEHMRAWLVKNGVSVPAGATVEIDGIKFQFG